jgi:hypothetical protein
MKMCGKMRYRSMCSAPWYQIDVRCGWVSCHNCFILVPHCLKYCVKGWQITKEQYNVSCDKFEAVDLLREIKNMKLSLMLATYCSRSFRIVIMFAGVCYEWFMAKRYKFKQVMYVWGLLVIDRRGGTERNLNEITAGSWQQMLAVERGKQLRMGAMWVRASDRVY